MDLVILDPSRGSRQGDAGVDDRDLQLGDLLLFCRNPRHGVELAGKFAGVIRAVQTAHGYCFDDARWHHVAIYVGDGQMVEARWGLGVVAGPIAGRFPGHLLRVRRNRLESGLQAEVGRCIALAVHSAIGKPYDFRALLGGGDTEEEAKRSYVCSTLFCDAYDLALDDLARGRSVAEREQLAMAKLITDAAKLPLPALLSETSLLQDIPARWTH